MCSLRENIHEIVTVHSVHSNSKSPAGYKKKDCTSNEHSLSGLVYFIQFCLQLLMP